MIKEIFGKVRSEYGFTGQDLIIAMFILVLFLGLMTGVYVNLSNTSYEIKLTADATEIGTNILEFYDSEYYDEINTSSKTEVLASNYSGISWNDKYDVYVSVTENQEKNKKEISVSVEFEFKDETHRIENSMIKEKEPIRPTNSPDMSNISVTPIKFVYDDASELYGHFFKTQKTDNEWYNYENKKLAVAVSGGEFDNNGIMTGFDDIYVWIPAFYVATDTNSNNYLAFFYKDTDKIIKKNGDNSYELIDSNTVSASRYSSFIGKNGVWVNVNLNNNNVMSITENDTSLNQVFSNFITYFDYSNTVFPTND
ncbi:MAG: hypothetical protein IKG42_02910 [Clostridia bacterium]|nr:hypothetical protein [Clostridia bacterium]